ncbi:hypothetical protein D3C72_1897700 [compost metagenome]
MVLVPDLVTAVTVPPPARPKVTSYWLVTTLNSRTASIEIEYGAPLRLVVLPADVGFLAFIPSMV